VSECERGTLQRRPRPARAVRIVAWGSQASKQPKLNSVANLNDSYHIEGKE